MEKFHFIPPVDESAPPLKARQWAWLSVSFLLSLTLFILPNVMGGSFVLFLAWPITAIPMWVYGQNRRSRIVGRVFLAAISAFVLYDRWNWIEQHTFESSIVVFAFLAVIWIILWVDQMGNLILKRLDALQTRVNSVESKLDRIGPAEARDEDSISFGLPAPAEYGWDTIRVFPAMRRCERSIGYGGPPIFNEVIEYDLRPQHHPESVFARLVEMWKEDLSETSYQVINGTLLEDAEGGGSSGNRERRLFWHELRGPETYVILSAHGRDKAFFRQKRRGIENALTQLNARAELLGAVQVEEYGAIRYQAKPNAAEKEILAIDAGIANLVSERSLREYGVSPREVFNQDYALVLDKLIGEHLEDFMLSDMEKAVGDVS